MPLVAHNGLPTYQRLRADGHVVLSEARAAEQDIRGLHIGLLNMMPDAALAATERQFFRLIGSSNTISQFFMHPFTIDALPRGATAAQHISQFYESFDSIREAGLDALIISGANVTRPDLAQEVFWEPLKEVMDWAYENVTSTLCSCLASHAVMQFRYGQTRSSLQEKQWGVFRHRVVEPGHALVHDINTDMDVPHSRFNVVNAEQFEAAGLHVLIESEQAGVQMAVSPDGFRTVFFQGHPEYDRISLLKEYKREVGRYISSERETYPPVPDHYFNVHCLGLLEEYQDRIELARVTGVYPPPFPEGHLTKHLRNTWHDTGEAVVGNWVGLVYQLTHAAREKPFMDGIDVNNPLLWTKLVESEV